MIGVKLYYLAYTGSIVLLVALTFLIVGLDFAMNDTEAGSVVMSSTFVTEFTREKNRVNSTFRYKTCILCLPVVLCFLFIPKIKCCHGRVDVADKNFTAITREIFTNNHS